MGNSDKKTKNLMPIKITILGLLLVIFFIAGYLFKIMILEGDRLKSMSISQSFREVATESRRGTIFDRNGMPLAVSIDAYSLAIDPLLTREDKDLPAKIKKLAEITGLQETVILEAVNKQNRFVWIARQMEDGQTEEIRKLRLRGAVLILESKRVYPKGQFLSNVIGFVGQDNKGLEGLELYYDSLLRGTPGKILVEEDSKGRSINSSVHQIVPSVEGRDIYLTIDGVIQYETERRLYQAVEELRAQKAVAVVYDVTNGEIISMASYPTFDPNQYRNYSPDVFKNLLVASVYEVGSTFKPFVAAAALEESKVRPNEIFVCDSSIKVLNYSIREIIYPKSHGNQTIVQALQNSSNVGFVQIGQRLGKEDFYRYLHGFGLSSRTGIDLYGERNSVIIPENRATILDLSVSSIGQGNALTPLQLIRGFAAIVADGRLTRPHLLLKAVDSRGEVILESETRVERLVISPETSQLMRDALKSVVDEGTGRRARIAGFNIAGKTGTAQKISPDGGYLKDEVVTSFIGFAPLNSPRFAALVMIDNPRTFKTGSQTAAPVFRDVIEKTLSHYQITPEILPEDATMVLAPKNDTQPGQITQDYIGLNKDAAREKQSRDGRIQIIGEGTQIVAQYPFPGEALGNQQQIQLYLADPEKNEVILPNLQGLTILEASRLLEQMGLIIRVTGGGFAQGQLPEAGTIVKRNSQVQVQFGNNQDRSATQ